MLVILFFLVVMCSSSWTADPAPCCIPQQFKARMYSLTAVLTAGSTLPVINDDVIELTYDFTRQQTRQEGQTLIDPATGARANFTVYNDYKNHQTYTIKGGVCTQTALNQPLVPPCITANFTYGGTYRVGSSASNTQVQIWSGTYLGTLWMNTHVSDQNCAPVSVNFFGDAPDGSAKLLTSYQFLDVRSDVTLHESDFRRPDECKHVDAPVGK
ncbi:uncharacterized protein LOC127881684 [Dreissena polymorpha]|uniref:Uncharacterized protein n=1 Tax=Dreissena polymorpha TaxID=45954 RepID=A0A9D4JPN9_DREPO|nr:uncharacterized protein LOC127881684 [Dreissena polymorpha]KAH3819950.1 hypothetical protein DPMN_121694 [Dreissena polymorpha]